MGVNVVNAMAVMQKMMVRSTTSMDMKRREMHP